MVRLLDTPSVTRRYAPSATSPVPLRFTVEER